MLKTAAAFAALAAAICAAFQSTNFSLSVLSGGVMGLANLWAWQRVVARVVANNRDIPPHNLHAATAVAPLLLKFMGPALVLLLLAWTPANLLGIGVGYGSTILGMLVERWWMNRQDLHRQASDYRKSDGLKKD